MHLYHLTLQRATGVLAVAYGAFSAPKVHEIALVSGSCIEIVRPDENGRLQYVGRSEAFGQVRSIAAFRLTGAKRDYLIVGSDSGAVTVVQFDGDAGRFERVHCETFGKSGVRRIVPGQYTVADPRGRACLLGAVEKQKFVYVLNRDAKENLTISSPLEAHKTGVVCYHMAALDVGFENPIFAALERPYEPPGTKVLVLYELDLGLNHVVRKHAIPVDDTANLICSVPGGGDGPSGALVCSHGKVSYVSLSREKKILTAPLPYRQGDRPTNTLIVSAALHKQRGRFFFLFCTERGDLHKVDLEWEEETCSEIRVKYLDTLPNAASAMCVMRTGFLFATSEFGDHHFYQIVGLGDDDDPASGMTTSAINGMDKKAAMALGKKMMFTPRAATENLQLANALPSLSPVLGLQVDDFCREGATQLALACGRGSASSLRLLRRGFAVQEMAVSELQAAPTAVFTVKEHRNDEHDKYIVVSFVNATLVLRIGETVEEVSQSGLLSEVSTIAAALLGEDSLVQVHANGVRLIRKSAAITEWQPPAGAVITSAAVNPAQVAISLSVGDVVYFELDPESGNLDEIEKLDGVVGGAQQNGVDTAGGSGKPCLAFSSPGKSRERGMFLTVSDGVSNVVRVLGIGKEGTLEYVAIQALPSPAESLAIIDVGLDMRQLVLLVGTTSGVLLRLKIDSVAGSISDKRSRFIGSRPVRLRVVNLGGLETCFALSSKPWVLHPQTWGRTTLSPLCTDAIDNAASFSSEQCPEGFVAISGSDLRILMLESPEKITQAALDGAVSGVIFNSVQANLERTPRKILNITLPGESSNGLVVTIQTDQRCGRQTTGPGAVTGTMAAGKWSSSIKLLSVNREDIKSGNDAEAEDDEDELPCATELDSVPLDANDCAISGCVATFQERPGEVFICVGIAKGLIVDATSPIDRRVKPEQPATAELRLFKVTDKPERKLELVHVTPIERPSYALHCFHGRILAAMAAAITKNRPDGLCLDAARLLNFLSPLCITSSSVDRQTTYFDAVQLCTIASLGDRIFVGDVQESIRMFQYKASENRLRVVADDSVPRWITTMCVVDYQTVFSADKFGNVFVLRLPAELSDTLESEPTGGRLWESGSSAPHKLSLVCSFHVGSMVHAVAKVNLGGSEDVLLYTTISGAIGVLSPLPVRSDVDLLQQLEIALREAAPPLCGRDHLSYRSYYYPVRNVVDGDLIEMYPTLPHEKQKELVEDYDRTPADVLHKLEDLRERVL